MTSTVLTDAEKNACLFLADLFLDIEVTSNKLDYMARSLDELKLPLSTLDKIPRFDLFPILIYNLWSVAGEWMGFDEPSLIQQIEYQRMNPPGILTGSARAAAWLAHGTRSRRKCSIGFKVVVTLSPHLSGQIEFELHRLINI